MEDLYARIIYLLPSWFIAVLAFLAAGLYLALSIYLLLKNDHLIMRGADLGGFGIFSALVGIHYILIIADGPGVNYTRGIAVSRVAWALFFGANIVILSRYLFAIGKLRLGTIVNS